MPRLGSVKSRNGCQRCKQRRVKCDEKVPCSACGRHGLKCSLLDRTASRNRPRQGSAESQEHAASSVSDHLGRRESARLFQLRSLLPAHEAMPEPPAHSPQALSSVQQYLSSQETAQGSSLARDPFPYLIPLVNDAQTLLKSPQQWMTDLELMHHYSAVTWRSLPRATDHPEIWQIEVPKLAFKHEFLMHQILAISAFHVAHLDPVPGSAKRHQLIAIQHQNKAIAELRSAITHLDDSTCDAVFVAASLSVINGFATFSQPPERPDDQTSESSTISIEPPNLDNLLDIFRLLRGLKSILSAYEQDVEKGPLGCLLRMEQKHLVSPFLTALIIRLSASDLLLQSNDVGSTQLAYCCEATASLIEWIARAISDATAPEFRLVSTWPIAISEEFLTLMSSRDERALRLLDYYCQILNQAGGYSWYLSGWAKSVQNSIGSGCASSGATASLV